MSYLYSEQRQHVFTEDGQRLFLAIRDKAGRLLKDSGAVRMEEIMVGHSGDSWTMLACVDRLVELGELREIPQGQVAGQHRVFVREWK